jgi:hypothetical protein
VKNRFQNLPFKCNLQRYTVGIRHVVAEALPAVGRIGRFA